MFQVGDKVQLTNRMREVCVELAAYEEGIIAETPHSRWNIVYVKWNGIDHSIGMREDEIELTS